MRRECRERFPQHRLQRKLLVSDPGMHHDTCVTHVPWCMSGSLTRGGGENVPGIPGVCTARKIPFLARGPLPESVMTKFYDVLWYGLTLPDCVCPYANTISLRPVKSTSDSCSINWKHLKNTYELLNLRSLKFSNKMHIFQCMGKIFCV